MADKIMYFSYSDIIVNQPKVLQRLIFIWYSKISQNKSAKRIFCEVVEIKIVDQIRKIFWQDKINIGKMVKNNHYKIINKLFK